MAAKVNTVECDLCDGVARTGRLQDGDRGHCASCGHPGTVVVDDEDEDTEYRWVPDDINCGRCEACRDELDPADEC